MKYCYPAHLSLTSLRLFFFFLSPSFPFRRSCWAATDRTWWQEVTTGWWRCGRRVTSNSFTSTQAVTPASVPWTSRTTRGDSRSLTGFFRNNFLLNFKLDRSDLLFYFQNFGTITDQIPLSIKRQEVWERLCCDEVRNNLDRGKKKEAFKEKLQQVVRFVPISILLY